MIAVLSDHDVLLFGVRRISPIRPEADLRHMHLGLVVGYSEDSSRDIHLTAWSEVCLIIIYLSLLKWAREKRVYSI